MSTRARPSGVGPGRSLRKRAVPCVAVGMIVGAVVPARAGDPFSVLPPPPAAPAVPPTVDLPTLLGIVRRDSPSLTAARAAIDVAASERADVDAYPNPNVSYGLAIHAAGDDTFNGTTHALLLAQPIRIVGKASVRARHADAAVSAACAEVAATERDTLLAAWRALVALQAQSERVTLARALVASARPIADAVASRAQAGVASAFDVSRIAREIGLLDRDRANAEVRLDAARRQLALIAGHPEWRPDPAVTLADTLRAPSSASPDSTVPAAPLAPSDPADHPARLLAERRIAEADAAYQQADRERWPDAVVSAGLQWTTHPGSLAPYVGISFDLMTFDRARAATRRAAAEAAQRRLEAEAVARTLDAQIAAARALVSARREALARWDSDIMTGLDAMRAQADEAYRGGRITLLEVLDVIRNEADARSGRIDREEELAEANLALAEALGTPL